MKGAINGMWEKGLSTECVNFSLTFVYQAVNACSISSTSFLAAFSTSIDSFTRSVAACTLSLHIQTSSTTAIEANCLRTILRRSFRVSVLCKSLNCSETFLKSSDTNGVLRHNVLVPRNCLLRLQGSWMHRISRSNIRNWWHNLFLISLHTLNLIHFTRSIHCRTLHSTCYPHSTLYYTVHNIYNQRNRKMCMQSNRKETFRASLRICKPVECLWCFFFFSAVIL